MLYKHYNMRFYPSIRVSRSQDFMFRLTKDEWEAARSLRSQNAILKTGRGLHRKHPPSAYTEHGALMAATLLNSPTRGGHESLCQLPLTPSASARSRADTYLVTHNVRHLAPSRQHGIDVVTPAQFLAILRAT